MEVKSVIGTRRSIRFFEPWREVEREKIQAILEATYRAPRMLETDFLRIVVMYRDRLSEEELATLQTPTTTAQLDMAPVVLIFYAESEAFEASKLEANHQALMDLGVLNPSHGWTKERYASSVGPYLQGLADDADRVPISFGRDVGGPTVSREVMRLARTAIGVAQTFALLAAVDEGLSAQLSAINTTTVKAMMGIPDSWIPSSPMLLGYHGESRAAGGQRPREAFEEDFFELRYGHPFYREPAVVEHLRECDMIQPGAPFPWRMTEVRALARKFGLPD
ncbi:MAG: nitroreductase family protein [Dehalococcoidia bacterium]|nr:nitroreductase family protein [Dehalococcoidia bacterium]